MVYLTLLLGVFACSTAVIFIRISGMDPVLLAGYRTVLAALVLSPLLIKYWRRHWYTFRPSQYARCILPAIALAFHFISWNFGARMTGAANASLIVNLAPLALPFFLHFLAGEQITRRESLGTLLALAGVVILTGGDSITAPENVRGNITCFLSMLTFAAYLALGRSNRSFPSIWMYVVPVYALTGLFSLLTAAAMGIPFATAPSSTDLLMLLALVFIPTIVGHTGLNHALKYLRGQIVSIVNLGQFFFAGVMAVLIFAEWPGPAFYPGCALILAGALLAMRPAKPAQ